jgi:SAM-dependent methyltransferase
VNYCKLCDVEDFADPSLSELIRDIYPTAVERTDPEFPLGWEYRKHWEVAMAARTLRELGALGDGSELLGVGAGTEATSFWLTRFGGRVFATDLYLQRGEWTRDAVAPMLTDPGRFAPGPWNAKRLVVQHMNALELQYEDESFQGIYSSGSIEHFGNFREIRQAVCEMFRVLKPAGVLTVSTEFRLEGPSPGLPNVWMFDEDELSTLFGGLGWSLASSLDLSLSSRTLEGVVPFSEATADVRAGRIERRWSRFPHIVLREGEHLWTSVHIAFVKEG